MFKSLIELNKSNSWVLITTFYVHISHVIGIARGGSMSFSRSSGLRAGGKGSLHR